MPAEISTRKMGWGVFVICVVALSLVSCSPKRAATREDRLKWNLASLTNDYATVGHKDSKWDENAREALRDFARIKSASDDEALILTSLAGGAAEAAVAAGCDDPMVRYLSVRYGEKIKAKPAGERKEPYRAAASNLQNSAYSPLRKFYANVDAAEVLYAGRNTNVWPLVSQIRNGAIDNLDQTFQDQTLPEAEAYEAADALFEMLARNTGQLTNAYCRLATTLSASGAKPAVAALVKAEFYLKYAWRARGNGTADQVTEEGWRLFHERLAEAEQALNRAWSHDPYDAQIPTLMITVALGQQKPRPEMETWFQRAMKLGPNNYAACRAKLHYLLPQWYGSREDMLEFGRECVASTNWGGQVPLILVDAHAEFSRTLPANSRAEYWLLSDVWPDIAAAYEKFARTEPNATKFRYSYAAYAARCNQWPAFKEQIKFIQQDDGNINTAFFGGKEDFEQLLEQAGQTNAVPK